MKIPTITTGNITPRPETTPSAGSGRPQQDSGLQPGRLLKARVLSGSTPQGKVLLDVAGQKIAAKTLVKLVTGDHIWLEVNQGGTSPSLSLASQKGAVHNFLELLFTNPQQPDTLLNRILPLLNQFSSGNKDSVLPPLAQLIVSLASSGQGAKADPAAVKLMALLYGGTSPGAGQEAHADIMQQLQHLLKGEKLPSSLQKLLSDGLDFLDKHHQINTSPPGRDDPTVFLFPCFFREEAGWGEWMFSRTAGGEAGASSFELNFFLEMSRLGPLSLYISGSDKDLHGTFYLSEQGAADHLERRIPELVRRMQDLDYQDVSFQCRLAHRDVVRDLKDSLMEHAGLNSFSLVDVTA